MLASFYSAPLWLAMMFWVLYCQPQWRAMMLFFHFISSFVAKDDVFSFCRPFPWKWIVFLRFSNYRQGDRWRFPSFCIHIRGDRCCLLMLSASFCCFVLPKYLKKRFTQLSNIYENILRPLSLAQGNNSGSLLKQVTAQNVKKEEIERRIKGNENPRDVSPSAAEAMEEHRRGEETGRTGRDRKKRCQTRSDEMIPLLGTMGEEMKC